MSSSWTNRLIDVVLFLMNQLNWFILDLSQESHLCESVRPLISSFNQLTWLAYISAKEFCYNKCISIYIIKIIILLFRKLLGLVLGMFGAWRRICQRFILSVSKSLRACFNLSLCSTIISPVSILNTTIQHSNSFNSGLERSILMM